MQRKITLTLLVSLACIICVWQPVARCARRPLSKAELLALVAGDIPPENVALDIQSRELAFVPDAPFNALLKSAGADAEVFAATSAAKSTHGEASSASANNLGVACHRPQPCCIRAEVF